MHDYTPLKQKLGRRVSQTIDSPILILDFWELSDAFVALGIVLAFGIVLSEWGWMVLGLIVSLVLYPVIKRNYPRGILLHSLYQRFGVSLPGLLNPKGERVFSD